MSDPEAAINDGSEVVQNLLYCIHSEPRLFRWNAAVIEWADPESPDEWQVVPGQQDGNADNTPCCPDCGATDLIDLRCPNCYPFGSPIPARESGSSRGEGS